MLRNVTNRSPNAARPLGEHVLPSHPARARIVVAAELVQTGAKHARMGAASYQAQSRCVYARVLGERRAKAAGGRRKANRREGLRAAGACVQAAHEAACIRARVRVRATSTTMSGDAGGADMGEAERGEQLRPLKVRCDGRQLVLRRARPAH